MKMALAFGLWGFVVGANGWFAPNLVPNGDWETGQPPASWKIQKGDGVTLGFDKGMDGKRCLDIMVPVHQSIRLKSDLVELTPARKYRLLYHYKTAAPQIAWSNLSVEYFTSGRSLGSQSISFMENQAEWKTKEYLLIIPEGATACKVHVRIMDAGQYLVDDISIVEVSHRAARKISLVGKMREIPIKKAASLPRIPAAGKYSVQPIEGVWWLIDPAGNAFWNISLWGGGPMGASGELPLRKYIKTHYLESRNEKTHHNDVFDGLIAWGFNSIGSGIEIEPMNRALQMRKQAKAKTLPYLDTLVMSVNLPSQGGLRLWEIAEGLYGKGNVKVEDLAMVDKQLKPVLGTHVAFSDVFNEKFRNAYDHYVKEWFAERGKEELFAVCLDNELPWAELPRSIYSPACRKEFAKFAKAKFGGNIDAYNQRYGTHLKNFTEIESQMPPQPDGVYQEVVYEFLRHYVKEYFTFQIATVRKYRPDVLIIGQRISAATSMDSLGRMKHVYDWCADLFSVYDIVGINLYPHGQDHFTHDQLKSIEWFHQKSGRPIMITEWCVCCEESGVPTTVGWPLWSTVPTWEDRGNGYKNCLTQLASLPYVVGAHWFASYNTYVWINGVRYPGYNHGFYQDDFVPNPLFLKKAVETNRIVTQMERKAGFTVEDIHYLKE